MGISHTDTPLRAVVFPDIGKLALCYPGKDHTPSGPY